MTAALRRLFVGCDMRKMLELVFPGTPVVVQQDVFLQWHSNEIYTLAFHQSLIFSRSSIVLKIWNVPESPAPLTE